MELGTTAPQFLCLRSPNVLCKRVSFPSAWAMNTACLSRSKLGFSAPCTVLKTPQHSEEPRRRMSSERLHRSRELGNHISADLPSQTAAACAEISLLRRTIQLPQQTFLFPNIYRGPSHTRRWLLTWTCSWVLRLLLC